MLIEWTDGEKEVPGVGLMNDGDIREIPDGIARGLIEQGQAVEVKNEDRPEEKQTPAGRRQPQGEG